MITCVETKNHKQLYYKSIPRGSRKRIGLKQAKQETNENLPLCSPSVALKMISTMKSIFDKDEEIKRLKLLINNQDTESSAKCKTQIETLDMVINTQLQVINKYKSQLQDKEADHSRLARDISRLEEEILASTLETKKTIELLEQTKQQSNLSLSTIEQEYKQRLDEMEEERNNIQTNFETTLSGLQTELKTKNEDLIQLQQNRIKMIDEFTSKLDKIKNEREQQVSNLSSSLYNLSQKTNEQIKSLEDGIKVREIQIQKLENQLEEEKDRSSIEDQIALLTAERDELMEYRTQASSELKNLQNKINEDSLIYRKLTDQIITLEEDLRSLRYELDICDKKVQKCISNETELKRLQEERNNLFDKLKHVSESDQKQINDLKVDIETITNELNTKMNKVIKENKILEDKNLELTNRVFTKTKELENETRNNNKAIERYTKMLDISSKDAKSLRSKIKLVESRLEEQLLKGDNSESIQRIELLEKQLYEMNQIRKNLENELKIVTNSFSLSVENTNLEISDLKKELEELQKEYDFIYEEGRKMFENYQELEQYISQLEENEKNIKAIHIKEKYDLENKIVSDKYDFEEEKRNLQKQSFDNKCLSNEKGATICMEQIIEQYPSLVPKLCFESIREAKEALNEINQVMKDVVAVKIEDGKAVSLIIDDKGGLVERSFVKPVNIGSLENGILTFQNAIPQKVSISQGETIPVKVNQQVEKALEGKSITKIVQIPSSNRTQALYMNRR